MKNKVLLISILSLLLQGAFAQEKGRQYLVFQITPATAILEVNDQIWELNVEGEAREYVDFGTYSYRVQAKNYYAEEGSVTVNNPNDVKVITVMLRPKFGWIEVAGTDVLQGASVYIDNSLVGKAPCKSGPLESGQHMVRKIGRAHV